jgi:ribosome-associated protein
MCHANFRFKLPKAACCAKINGFNDVNWIQIAHMDNLKLKLAALVQSLDNSHADNIVVIDVSQQTSFTDFMIVCTARSSRHIRAVADNVISEMRAVSLKAIGQQGTNEGEWALIDFSDFIVNIMLTSARDFYNLEGLWQSSAHA